MLTEAPRRRGRPTRAGDRSSERLVLRLTPAERAEVDRLADLNCCTASDVVRVALHVLAGEDGFAPKIILGGVVGTVLFRRTE
jgi:hypothetical protein